MNTRISNWLLPASLILSFSFLPIIASAENDISPSSQPIAPSSWEIRQHAELQATELISTLAQGSFSTMCSKAGCGVFVEPLAGCVPGTKYPLLINSAKQVGVVPTQCTTIPGDKEGQWRYVVMLQQRQTLLKAMIDEINLTIAFPTQSGHMNVLEINMSGVRDVLATLIPDKPDKLGDSAARAKETTVAPPKTRQFDL